MFNPEDKVGWNELAPSLQELFSKGLEKHIADSRKNLNDEIDREIRDINKVKQDILDNINKFKSDQFGCGGIKGKVLKCDSTSLYADDHFFNINYSQGTEPDWLYGYNLISGECCDSSGNKKEIPYRSFLYEPASERLWYYWSPNRFVEIKESYINKNYIYGINPIKLIASGFDTYENHDRYFKLYDNGWCEQAGAYSHYKSDLDKESNWIDYHNRYVDFKIPYKDTDYIVTVGGELWPYTTDVCTHGYCTYLKETNRMRVSICGNTIDVHWRYTNYYAAGFTDLTTVRQELGI